MANYTQTNIYRRQMNELGLNTKQYSELIGIPYEVVKDMIYDKEGDYSMEIKNLLRNTMFNKHQEIENDFENAKYKAMEIKRNDVDYIEWYNNVYSFDMLKSVLKVSSIMDFERKYTIVVDGKKASHWYYTILSNKREYEGHDINKDKKLEFITQLYDIVVNGNGKAYYGKKANLVMNTQIPNGKINYVKWYKTFNVKQFMHDNNLINADLIEALGFSPAVISRLINKRKYTRNSLEKLYNYVMSKSDNNGVKSNNYEVKSDNYEVKSDSFDYFEWFKNYDLKKYMRDNLLTNEQLGKKIGLGVVSVSQLANKKFYTLKTLVKLYNYISKEENISEIADKINDTIKDIRTGQINGKEVEIEKLDNGKYDMVVKEVEEVDDEDDNNTAMKLIEPKLCEEDIEEKDEENEEELYQAPTIQLVNTNDDILRKILINRLTEEEKELIRIFGGKLC